ncbi:DNA/RNA polymerases superfamily protein [Gossypium australe]|uniref:DNA/RNA polymerases superfamily protein n=1 Tax=Gossypium australe TaxID=47621 RepID=A0A5B6W818_9ROSI|nr:DNA/RNA polymerases superfamily protein [Gossypium australe]
MAIMIHLKVAQDRQKAYVDRRRKDMFYEVDYSLWMKGETVPEVHWTLRNSGAYWASSILFSPPTRTI